MYEDRKEDPAEVMRSNAYDAKVNRQAGLTGADVTIATDGKRTVNCKQNIRGEDSTACGVFTKINLRTIIGTSNTLRSLEQ